MLVVEKMDDGEISKIGFRSHENNPPTATSSNNTNPLKRKRNLPGNPDPEAEVIALSPETLMARNRFVCEICGKGFQRDQNLQLHRRGHNLPWKLKQRTSKEVRKRVYVCPEKSCVHNHPSRALGDLTGIKKHFCRKHGEKNWKCDKCSKRYAVQSDWKAHSKTCGTREYKCDCGTIFSRRDSFITHRAFCDALAEETARVNAASTNNIITYNNNISLLPPTPTGPNNTTTTTTNNIMPPHFPSLFNPPFITDHQQLQDAAAADNNNNNINSSRGLSLWMPHHHHHHNGNNNLFEIHHQLAGGGNHLNHPPLVSSLSNHHHHHRQQQQFNWVFGNSHNNNKISNPSSSCTGELTSTTSNIGSCHHQQQLISVPSLYSSQHHHHHQTTSSSSATALLQKAAQIGATSTTSDPSFLGSLGLKCTTTTTTTTNDINININNDNSKYCGMYGSGGSVLTSIGGGGSCDQSQRDHNNNNCGSEMSLMHSAKRRQIVHNEDINAGAGGGQTRDFLGVGVQTICHPSSINGWI